MSKPKGASTPMDSSHLKLEGEEDLLPSNESYRQAVAALLYIVTTTCPAITATVGILCRRVSKPCQRDWNAIKRIFKYIKEIQSLNLKISVSGDLTHRGYVGADWAGDSSDQKSTSGYLFKLGENSIFWSSRKQVSVALSSTEAEYVSTAYASQEVIWLKQLLQDFGKPLAQPTVIYEDNQGLL
ncbi:uncharacterized protein [Dendrobates tinctorius]|uniref:uncharacterized protein n=1 Tax=Dendrobates tinctorius TaxID=92724 RepID=UPI003CC97F9D